MAVEGRLVFRGSEAEFFMCRVGLIGCSFVGWFLSQPSHQPLSPWLDGSHTLDETCMPVDEWYYRRKCMMLE